MTLLCGLAKNVLMLFAARVGVGIGEASLLPSAHSMIADCFPREQRGRALSLFSLGIFAGAGIAFIFGGIVAEFAARTANTSLPIFAELQPWRLTLLIAGLPGILIVLLMLTVKEPTRRERLTPHSEAIPPRQALVFLRKHARVYAAIIIGSAFLALAAYSLFAWTPAFFIRVFAYSPREIGVSFGLILITAGTLAGFCWITCRRVLPIAFVVFMQHTVTFHRNLSMPKTHAQILVLNWVSMRVLLEKKSKLNCN